MLHLFILIQHYLLSMNYINPVILETIDSSILKENQLNPLPIQYLGSKNRISEWILDIAEQSFPSATHFFDLFAGSGSISLAALNRGLTPIINDIQPYSVCLLKGIFQSKTSEIDELIELLNNNNSKSMLLRSGRGSMEFYLNQEINFLNDKTTSTNWTIYKEFCEHSKIISSNDEVDKLRQLKQWNLFSCMYANTYFGIKQCLELDLIRELAEHLPESKKNTLLGTTISVMTQCVSSTTHLAQYLKISSESTAKNILRKRKTSIITEVISCLTTLRQFKVFCDIDISNLDYLEALKQFPNSFKPQTVVYADPPYFKEHYSRYYHVLDTLYYYDFPNLTFNPRLNQITTGRYRDNRIVSDFGLRSKVENAFSLLFIKAKKLNLPVMLSYANTSLVRKEEIIKIADNLGFTSELHTKELLHSGQGQKRNKLVLEYLFIFKP
jgi:adenine-specific DNA-methyltransferase